MLKFVTILLTLYGVMGNGGGGWQNPGGGLYPDLPNADDTPGYPNAPPESDWHDPPPPSYGDAVDRVRLQDIKVLTLRHGEMTTGRRSRPLKQLNCVGGSAKGKFNPSVVQCYNRGFDGTSVQWECKADMDTLYRFGDIQVACEGYDFPGDPYILTGSCGLEYTLQYTRQGRQDQEAKQHHNQHHQREQHGGRHQSSKSLTWEEITAFWESMGSIVHVVKVTAVIFMVLILWGSGSFDSTMSKFGLLLIAAALLYFQWKYLFIIGIVLGVVYCCSLAPNRTRTEYPDSTPGAGGWNAPGSGPSTADTQYPDLQDREENTTNSTCSGSTRRRHEDRNVNCNENDSDSDGVTPDTRTASGFGGTRIR